jgi:hypothetical protein
MEADMELKAQRRIVLGRAGVAAWVVALAALASAPGLQAQDTAPRVRHDFAPVGLVPGQTLRITVASLRPAAEGDQPPPTGDRVRLFLLDARGRRIADSGSRELPAVQMEWFSVERDRLPAGEPGTGRLQVRAVVVAWNAEGLPPSPVRPSVELLNAAGRTLVFLPPSPILPPGPISPAPGE